MAGNFFYSKVYKGGFDIKSLENARPRRYNSKIWWSIHKRRFNIVENKNRNTAAIGVDLDGAALDLGLAVGAVEAGEL